MNAEIEVQSSEALSRGPEKRNLREEQSILVCGTMREGIGIVGLPPSSPTLRLDFLSCSLTLFKGGYTPPANYYI